ncbi:protein Atg16l2-like [Scyliorhinus canicula]|uniref:protein Atg16l2-like n=1 Tax=Scyliorhinus canicula TaxID=7830 RepID=UPI0018F73339|nr:protein Atg16l2-like [Scyliorhinus canicula]
MATPRSDAKWRRHIIRQLQHRDRHQKLHFEALILSYNQLLAKSDMVQLWRDKRDPHLPSAPSLFPEPENVTKLQIRHQEKVNKFYQENGELAQEVFELNKQRKRREMELQATQSRLSELEAKLAELEVERGQLQVRIDELEQANSEVKEEYDKLQQLHRSQWEKLRKKELEGSDLIQSMIDIKVQAAADLNYLNEKPKRVKQKNLEKDLAVVSTVPIAMDTDTSRQVRKLSAEAAGHQEAKNFKPFRSFRSSSFTLSTQPKFLQSFKGIFRKRSSTCFSEIDCSPTNFGAAARVPARVRHSLVSDHHANCGYSLHVCICVCVSAFLCVCMLVPVCVHVHVCVCVLCSSESNRKRSSTCFSEIDCSPTNFGAAARVPARVRHSLEAHDGEVNAVKFSPSSKILATGGSDRRVKLWDIVGGMLRKQKVLEGSNDGVTSIEFDPSGQQLLTGSYDNTARVWSLKNCELKCVLSGHSAKVTAAKFKCYYREAVTGSHDRTIRVWDLSKTACIHSIPTLSRCSDVVCSDSFIISGHFDKKVRLWDSRAGMKTSEIPLQGKVTSLDINSDRTQLLSCSRDDLLNVTDLRMNETRLELRAEGFKCGADWTKAIFSPDGCYAVVGSSEGVLYVWDTLTGQLETSLVGQHRSSINAVSWSLSGEYVVTVDRTKMANLWSDC